MKTKFVFLLLPYTHLLDVAGPDQAILEAIGYGAPFETAYCDIGQKVTTTSGLPLGQLPHFSEMVLQPGDYLFIAGADVDWILSPDFKKHTILLEWLKYLHTRKVHLCSICTGAFVLAETGLLDGHECTTHFKRTAQLQSLYPKIKVTENILFTESDLVYTSAGIASGIDLTLHLIEQKMGSHFAHLVARELVVYNRRNGYAKQESDLLKFRNHIHSGIHKAQDTIIENIHVRNSLADLAEKANMSERNFTRIFKKETGITVNSYVNCIRKEKIKELIKNPDLSRIEVAAMVGLKSEKQLNRIIK